MRVDNERRRFSQTGAAYRLQAPGVLSKLVTFAAGATVLAAAVTVSLLVFAVVFAVVLAGALLAWSYLWWRTRDWRKQMRARQSGGRAIRGDSLLAAPSRRSPSIGGCPPDKECSERIGASLTRGAVIRCRSLRLTSSR
jgi:hypothetical protein